MQGGETAVTWRESAEIGIPSRADAQVIIYRGIPMNKITLALLAIGGLGLGTVAMAAETIVPSISKPNYEEAKNNAEAQYRVDDKACSTLSGNAKDICMAQAKGKESISKADAEAAYENTAAHREDARVARADAAYAVAMERCDDLAGNGKDVCVKEGKAALVKGKADAKVDRVVADSSHDAADKQATARTDAMADKNDANYKVALEKCDVLAGARKDDCVGQAKIHFDKT
jgi:hypothetical protein